MQQPGARHVLEVFTRQVVGAADAGGAVAPFVGLALGNGDYVFNRAKRRRGMHDEQAAAAADVAEMRE